MPKTDIMSVQKFGRQLVQTMDLDPVYVVVYHAQMDEEQLARWLLAYWCFYHVGTACWITEQGGYWQALAGAAATKEHPRSSERRHFRGQAAIRAVEELRGLRLTPRQILARLGHQNESPLFLDVATRVRRLRGFGGWIAFKVADMLERLGICPVQFHPTDIFEMFDSPRKGAETVHQWYCKLANQNPYEWSYQYLMANLGNLLAPPRNERGINIQEIETILCKWKSHLNKHYTVGKDIHEVEAGLLRYSRCKLSQRLIKAGKTGGLW